MKPILDRVTRAKILQIWFTALGLTIVAAVALGVNITVSTGMLLFGLALVPAVLVFTLWPAARTMTAGDVLRGTDPRN